MHLMQMTNAIVQKPIDAYSLMEIHSFRGRVILGITFWSENPL